MLRISGWNLVFGLAVSLELVLAIGCRGSKPTPIATPAVKPTATSASTPVPSISPTGIAENAAEATPSAASSGVAAQDTTEGVTVSNDRDHVAASSVPIAP